MKPILKIGAAPAFEKDSYRRGGRRRANPLTGAGIAVSIWCRFVS